MKSLPLAVQLYTLRDQCAQDFEGTLRAVARMGWRAVELAGFHGMPPRDLRKLLLELKLQPFAMHAGMDRLRNQLEEVIHEGHLLETLFIVCSALPENCRKNADGYRQGARWLDAAGARLLDHQLQLCYHNHAFEFDLFENQSGLDLLYQECESRNVKAELDVYWVKKGGGDPVQWIEQLGRRCALLHLKDMGADGGFAEVGAGRLDFTAILKAAQKAGTHGYIVEQDVCPRPPLESLAISLENLRRLAPNLYA